MYYIKKNENIVGNGLSKGELNQWLIDLDNSLPEHEKEKFRKDLGLSKQVNQADFEDFLYDEELKLPIETTHGEEILVIY